MVVKNYAHENDIYSVAEPENVDSEIQTLQQYDSRLSAACNRGKVDQQTFATCAYTMLNDEMATSSIGSFARQQQIALDEQYAKRMSDT